MRIYLDNAATSFPKPDVVYHTANDFMMKLGVSSGRGAYREALTADRMLYDTRKGIAKLFNIKDVSRIIFTNNVTQSLNLAIKGILNPGDHVVTSSMEHNAVWRPLKVLECEKGIRISAVSCDSKGMLDPQDLKKAIRQDTRLIVLLHASNVTGGLLPIAEAGSIAREYGIPFLVDSAQTAGVYPIDVESMKIDLLAFTGHKGLLGPMGTGGLYINEDILLKPLIEGGTGGDSLLESQPDDLPDRFEAGTMNMSGIAGLGEAVRFILNKGIEKIREKEETLISGTISGLSGIEGVTLYGPYEWENRVGVISFNIMDSSPQEIGRILDEKYDIMVRTGLHCAPCAHRTIGTIDRGTVRAGIGYFNTHDDINRFVEAIKDITKGIKDKRI